MSDMHLMATTFQIGILYKNQQGTLRAESYNVTRAVLTFCLLFMLNYNFPPYTMGKVKTSAFYTWKDSDNKYFTNRSRICGKIGLSVFEIRKLQLLLKKICYSANLWPNLKTSMLQLLSKEMCYISATTQHMRGQI